MARARWVAASCIAIMVAAGGAWWYLGSDRGVEAPSPAACSSMPGAQAPFEPGLTLDAALMAASDHLGARPFSLLYARGQEPIGDVCAFGGTPVSWSLYIRDGNGTQGGLRVSEEGIAPVGVVAREGDTLPDFWRQHPLEDWIGPEHLVGSVNDMLGSVAGPADHLTYELRMLGDRAVWIVTTSGGASEATVFVLDASDGRDLTGELEVAVPESRAREMVLARNPELAGWDAWSTTMYAETLPGVPYALYSTGSSYARHVPIVSAHGEGAGKSSTWVFEFHDHAGSGGLVAHGVFGGVVFPIASLPWTNNDWAIEEREQLIEATAGQVVDVTIEEARAEAATHPRAPQGEREGVGLQWTEVRWVSRDDESLEDVKWTWHWFLWREEEMVRIGIVDAVRGGPA